MRKMGLFPAEKAKKTYKPKPYEQMTHPGERIQVDVKVVPRRCIADPELRLFQYTAIDCGSLLPIRNSPLIPRLTSCES